MQMCYKILHHLGTRCCLPKTMFRTKIGGDWARGAFKKFGTLYVFLQPLKLATSNLVHNLVLGLAYQKTTFWTKNLRGLGQGSIQKNLGPLCISATVEASNFKFGTQLGFGTWTSSFTCQLISIIITTLIIYHSFTLSLQAQNLPFQQILSTVDFFYLLDCLHDNGTRLDLSCSSFYF